MADIRRLCRDLEGARPRNALHAVDAILANRQPGNIYQGFSADATVGGK